MPKIPIAAAIPASGAIAALSASSGPKPERQIGGGALGGVGELGRAAAEPARRG